MKQEIKRLFGNRVALQLVEEEYPGLIVPASTAERMYVLSRVIAIGDQVTQEIKVGDILFWQTNGMIQKLNRFDLNKVATFILNAGDMIARVKNRVINRGEFQVIGDWCLLKREVVQPNLIVIPGEVAEANQEIAVKWTLDDKGETVDKWPDNTPERELPVGAEVLVDRSRANPIKLGDESFYYIHKNSVIGTVG